MLTFFSGFGLGTILTPFFALFFPIDLAIGLTGVVHFFNGVFKLLLVGKHANKDIVYFTGLLRQATWNGFTPQNVPHKDVWYRPDLQEIAGVKQLENVLPYMLYAEQSSYDFEGAFPNTQRHYPENNHLQYALFWFFMAAGMVGVYIMRFLRP